LGLRSYRKRKIPRGYPISVIRDGIEEEVILPLEEFPATLQLIEFHPPAHFTKVPYESGIVVNASVITQVAGPPVEEIAKKLGVKTLRFKATFERDTFERLILKIVHGFAVSNLGLDGIEQSYVLPVLLSQRDDMGRWLGCDGVQQLNHTHCHALSITVRDSEIICRERWLRLIGQNVPFLKCSPAVFRLHSLSQCGQVVEVELIRRVPVKRPVWPALVVERHVSLQALVGGADGLVGV